MAQFGTHTMGEVAHTMGHFRSLMEKLELPLTGTQELELENKIELEQL